MLTITKILQGCFTNCRTEYVIWHVPLKIITLWKKSVGTTFNFRSTFVQKIGTHYIFCVFISCLSVWSHLRLWFTGFKPHTHTHTHTQTHTPYTLTLRYLMLYAWFGGAKSTHHMFKDSMLDKLIIAQFLQCKKKRRKSVACLESGNSEEDGICKYLLASGDSVCVCLFVCMHACVCVCVCVCVSWWKHWCESFWLVSWWDKETWQNLMSTLFALTPIHSPSTDNYCN